MGPRTACPRDRIPTTSHFQRTRVHRPTLRAAPHAMVKTPRQLERKVQIFGYDAMHVNLGFIGLASQSQARITNLLPTGTSRMIYFAMIRARDASKQVLH